MKKIIFLDIDGVLNIFSPSYRSADYVNLAEDTVEPHLMKRLEYIIEKTQASIVISSHWELSHIKTVLEQKRFKYLDKIIARTPRVTKRIFLDLEINQDRVLNKNDNNTYLLMRGDQIQEYLLSTDFKGNYIVLEDEIDDVCGDECNVIPRNKVIEIDMNEGLSNKNAQEAINILGRD